MAIYISRGPAEQLYVFRGTLASAVGAAFPDDFGAYKRRTSAQTAVGGAFSTPVEEWVGPDGRVIVPRAAYVRVAKQSAPGIVEPSGFGPWRYWCQSDSEEFKTANAVQLNRQAPVAPNAPMKTRYGSPVLLANGTQPVQPASGDPNGLDEWTGEPTGEPQP